MPTTKVIKKNVAQNSKKKKCHGGRLKTSAELNARMKAYAPGMSFRHASNRPPSKPMLVTRQNYGGNPFLLSLMAPLLATGIERAFAGKNIITGNGARRKAPAKRGKGLRRSGTKR